MNSTEQTGSVLDINVLCAAEQKYRQRIEQEPADTGARLRLAWCLLARAFHESGRESSLPQVSGDMDSHDAASPSNARLLLISSLKQVMMVLQISADPQEQREAQRLRSLVGLSGGKQSVQEVDEESNQVIAEITRALLHGVDGDSLLTARRMFPSTPDMLA